MAFSEVHELHVSKESCIYLMSYDEFNLDAFTSDLREEDRNQLLAKKHPSKQREFVASRRLFYSVFPDNFIQYTSWGAPYLGKSQNNPYISISHSNDLVGLAVSNQPIGMDMEPVRDLAKKLVHKFLSDAERSWIDCSDDLMTTKAWSAKEALYKLARRKELIFAQDIRLEMPISEDSWKCSVCTHDGWEKHIIQFETSFHNIIAINLPYV